MSRIDDTIHTAENAVHAAKAATGQQATNARESLMDGLRGVATIVSLARAIDLGKVRSFIGLARQRGPFGTLVLFSTGFAAGAGVAAVLTPMSGPELRRRLIDQLHGLFDGAEKAARKVSSKVGEEVQSEVHAGERKLDEFADKARDTFVNAERAAQDLAHKVQESLIAADQGREGEEQGNEQRGPQSKGRSQEQVEAQQGRERQGRANHTGKHHGHHASRH